MNNCANISDVVCATANFSGGYFRAAIAAGDLEIPVEMLPAGSEMIVNMGIDSTMSSANRCVSGALPRSIWFTDRVAQVNCFSESSWPGR